MADENEYRVDELAQAAGTTVRNVRAYQDRGLLPAPRREGRVGIYSSAHLARLRLIGALLDRGYTLANIGELLEAWERGQDVGDLLGFEAALGAPWAEPAATVSTDELFALFGAEDETTALGELDEALRIGLLEVDGDRFRVPNPAALEVAAVLVAAGAPLRSILASGRRLREDVDDIAEQFVDLVDTQVFAPLGEPLPPEEIPRLAELVQRLRPLSRAVVEAELAQSMERHVRARFEERLRRFVGSLDAANATEAS